MTDAAVDEVERDRKGRQLVRRRNNNQPLVWKCWWYPHLYALAAIIFTICKKIVTACAIASSCTLTTACAPGATSPSPP